MRKHFTKPFSQLDAPDCTSAKRSLTHPVHLLPEGVDDELEEGIILLLLLGERLLGLARLLPQLGERWVVGLLLLLKLPLPVGQTLEGKLTLGIAIPKTLRSDNIHTQCGVRSVVMFCYVFSSYPWAAQ